MAYAIASTSDGGYIIGGNTKSFGAGDQDWLILKLDAGGTVEWSKIAGGISTDNIQSVIQNGDGSYIAAGYTTSFGAGLNDFLIAKLDSSGSIVWSKTYGGVFREYGKCVKPLDGGGMVVAGYGRGAGEYPDIWIMRLDDYGSAVWQKMYGGSTVESSYSINTLPDGGFFAAGSVTTEDNTRRDIWVLRLDAAGSIVWQYSFGGDEDDWTHSAAAVEGGGFLVSGITNSFGAGGFDVWVLKIGDDGNLEWSKTYGGPGDDFAYSVTSTSSGGFVMAGATSSFGAGGDDVWTLKINGSGEIEWEMAYGGAGDDLAHAYSSVETSDGGYAIAGQTKSSGAGGGDIWLIKMDNGGAAPDFGIKTNAIVTDVAVMARPTFIIPYDTYVQPVDVTLVETQNAITAARRPGGGPARRHVW